MIYAILGTALGGFGAMVSLFLGAPVLVALAVYIGTGMACVACGIALAAVCLWRHPDQDDRLWGNPG
jgi:hypothetical protein